ncbi:MAG TPA: discoidin domain-containing protein [Pseudonocardiaceae bacterium]|nr:discoidin domain-containing protein [Pseudonocardiaceae bacterium]
MSTTRFAKHLSGRGRLAAAGAAAVVAAGAAAVITFGATPAVAQSSAMSPFAVSGAGASVSGMTEYEAENASTTGTKIGPDYTQGDLATEASGRQAVQLTSQGQYVEFTLTAQANAIDVDYALNQGSSGNLSLYINGTKYSSELSLTSQYSYITTSNIAGSKTHHFFNDTRLLLNQQLKAGDKVRLQVDSGDNAAPYTIDLADFYQVAGPIAQPSNSISVVSEGADPSGAGDSTNAFRQAVTDANNQGKVVWIPQGTFVVSSSLQVNAATIEGAGNWYSQVKANELIANGGSVSGPVNLSNFAILGSTVGRHDDSSANAINGSLGTGSVVNGLWIQNTNVGFWLMNTNSDLTIENSEIFDTSADGINFNGYASNSTVTDNFLRNTGDDGLAMWSLYSADTSDTFSNNTVVQPNLANGIAIYGGTNDTVSGNVVADSNALGSGIAISNQQFIAGDGFSPLAGTITVSGNTLIRTGAMNPNWNHPMGAIRLDSYDYAIQNVAINLTGNTVDDSPYSVLEVVSGAGNNLPVTGVTMNGATIDNVGTVVLQAEAQGSGTFSNVVATNVGVGGIYNCAYPTNTASFQVNLGSGNAGWQDNTYPGCTFPNPGSGGGTTTTTPPPPGTNLALNKTTSASGYTQVYPPSNAVDGNTSSYWESTDNAFPQWFGVDLGSAQSVTRLVLDLPPSTAWGARTQTFSILGSTDGSNFSTVVGSTGYTFDPATGNTVTISLPSTTSLRYLKLNFTANTGWPAGQLSELQAFSS